MKNRAPSIKARPVQLSQMTPGISRPSRSGNCRPPARWIVIAIVIFLYMMSLFLNTTRLAQSIANPTGTQGGEQSPPYAPQHRSQGDPRSLPYRTGQFLYANTSYQYRYSTKFVSKQTKTTVQVSSSEQRTQQQDLPTIVFGVCANAAKPVRRNTIRSTWGKEVPVYFLVAGDWKDVATEFQSQGDLLYLDIPEDYRNALTPKTFGFVHFASTVLPEIDYIFKTDDDVYINATEMSVELARNSRPDYYGLLRNGTAPIRPSAVDAKGVGKVSKWTLTREDYPEDLFPPYAHGTGYALSQRFARCGVQVMHTSNVMVHFMPWEDVATGMLAQACQVPLTSSEVEWNHFMPFDNMENEWIQFPYQRFKDGGVLVKILHNVKPWFFEPLLHQASLVSAREYGSQKIRDRHQRREDTINQQNQKAGQG